MVRMSTALAYAKVLSGGLLASILSSWLAMTLYAQPTGGNIMTDVSLTAAAACNTVRVRFNIPIRYLNHFPQDRGNEVRIQLKPLSVSPGDAQALLEREAFSPVDDGTPLDNVIYEGDMDGGPYLSLQFSRNVHFTVAQGADFRGINVFFGDAAANCPSGSSP